MTHLFRNFLSDKQIFIQNTEFWKKNISSLLQEKNIKFQKYLRNDIDGNPIFNFKVENLNKAVRIIQLEIESKSPVIHAYLDDVMQISDEEIIKELVIFLELSSESLIFANKLIENWIINDFSIEKMNIFIDELLVF